MQKHQIAEMHLGGTTGYGYNDSGREAVEALWYMLKREDVPEGLQITCGTHVFRTLHLLLNYVLGDDDSGKFSRKPYGHQNSHWNRESKVPGA